MRAVVHPLAVMVQPRGEQHRLPQVFSGVTSQQQYSDGPGLTGGSL